MKEALSSLTLVSGGTLPSSQLERDKSVEGEQSREVFYGPGSEEAPIISACFLLAATIQVYDHPRKQGY